MAEDKVQRAVLFDSGNCKFWSGGYDFVFEGDTYQPGILLIDSISAGFGGDSGGTNVRFTDVACSAIISDRNEGDNVKIVYIERQHPMYKPVVPASSTDRLIMESGDPFVFEDGDNILLEHAVPSTSSNYQGYSQTGNWYVTSRFWLVIGGIRNRGKGLYEISLDSPITLLSKSDTVEWAESYFKNRFGSDWFAGLSRTKETIVKIIMK